MKEIQRRKEEEERKRQEELAKQAAQAKAEAAEKAAYVNFYKYILLPPFTKNVLLNVCLYMFILVMKNVLYIIYNFILCTIYNFTGRKKHQKQMESRLKMVNALVC